MTQLPNFQSTPTNVNTPFQLMQTKWSAILNPVLSNPMTDPGLLTNITLASGDNVINHKLGKTPVGWIIVDINAVASIYRSASFNNLTLTLNASAPCTVNIAVF